MSAEEPGLDVQIEVPGTPEQVWDAIATGPGISAWFMPVEVDGSRMTFHHAPGESSDAEITDAEAPHRLRFVEGPGGAMATEFLVEARAGGTCLVRVVTSGFGDQGARDGWTAALAGLRLYLEHFAGREAAGLVAGGMVPGPAGRAWEDLRGLLGLGELAEGERFEVRAEAAPALAGVVELRLGTMAALRLDAPAPGLGFLGVGGPDDATVFAFLRAQLFGTDGASAVRRDEPAWRALLASQARVP